MAKVNKPTSTTQLSIEELTAQYSNTVAQIKKILATNKDVNDIRDKDKLELRTLYSRAAQYAKTLSDRTTDEDKSAKYRQDFVKLSAMAGKYGSVIRSQVPKTTMDDVKGLTEVKELVKSFVFMAQNPHLTQYYKLEGGLGMLMYGAPGTGKTMFAEAVANAMNLPLFIVTPADIFKSYVGESEQAVKQIFEEIDGCPDGAILFIDECESIFSKRNQDTKDYKAAVTTEILQRMNGFGVNGSKRIMIAATNRPDVIDSAYLRFKRFSHLVHVTPPDKEAKRAIIAGKLQNIALAPDITVEDILNMSENSGATVTSLGIVPSGADYYSAADICAIIEEACRCALKQLEVAKATTPIPVTRDMFVKAFAKIPPSISAETLKLYTDFRKSQDKK